MMFMGSNLGTHLAGVYYTCYKLSLLNWKITPHTQGNGEMHVVERDGVTHTIKIRSLSKEAPVPFPQGLDILDVIDYLVICNNLQGQPNLIVLEPETVRRSIHKDTVNEPAYWLQPPAYNEHGMTLEKAFG